MLNGLWWGSYVKATKQNTDFKVGKHPLSQISIGGFRGLNSAYMYDAVLGDCEQILWYHLSRRQCVGCHPSRQTSLPVGSPTLPSTHPIRLNAAHFVPHVVS